MNICLPTFVIAGALARSFKVTVVPSSPRLPRASTAVSSPALGVDVRVLLIELVAPFAVRFLHPVIKISPDVVVVSIPPSI